MFLLLFLCFIFIFCLIHVNIVTFAPFLSCLRDEIKLRLSGQIVLLEKAYSKIVYKELRNRIVTPPTAKLKFDAHFVNDTLNWKKNL